MREAVVLIHGIWMTGVELLLLRHRLGRCGYPARLFHYHSLLATPEAAAVRLNGYLQGVDADVVHLIAHSYGGIVLLHLFDRFPMQRPGRVVMLATPIRGSSVAGRLYQNVLTRPLIGRAAERGLLGDGPRWRGARDLGMIAGNKGIGLGALVTGALGNPHDGTISVTETRSPEITMHLTVPYSHFGMLFASPVAQAVCRFLDTGDFQT